jgi:hypothetical protein
MASPLSVVGEGGARPPSPASAKGAHASAKAARAAAATAVFLPIGRLRFYARHPLPGFATNVTRRKVQEMDEGWTVPLPAEVAEPFEVFVNGVLQKPGADYTVVGRSLRFEKPLAREGRLGVLRWASMFLGVAGTYRKNDSVDVVYDVEGRRTVASGLEIIPPSGSAPGPSR